MTATVRMVTPEQAARWLGVEGMDLEMAKHILFERPYHAPLLTRLALAASRCFGGDESRLIQAARAADRAKVDRYAALMQAGQWRAGEESEPIAVRFSPTPHPGDGVTGRHRLCAVMQLGRPVALLVAEVAG